jgi:putative membrane protein
MLASLVLSALLACWGDGWRHGWGPGGGWGWLWGWLWGPIVLLGWVAVIAAVVWFVVRGARPGECSGVDRARDVLAERYARGELTTQEDRQWLEQLR